MARQCRDCGREIDFQRIDGKWVPMEPKQKVEHWKVCPSAKARELRIRRGLEAGIYPLSPTAIDNYRACPRFYLWSYWSRLKEMGRISEELLAEYPDGPPKLPDIPAGALGRTFHQYAAARLKDEDPPAPTVPLEYWKDWSIMVAVFERQLESGQWEVDDAAIEDSRRYSWREGETTVELQCILDYWRYLGEGYAVLTDWKSGWQIESAGALERDAQALTNTLVLMRDFRRIRKARFQQVHFRQGGEVVGTEFTERDIDHFEEVLHAEVATIVRDTDYRPNPFCRVCPPGAHGFVSYPVKLEEGGVVEFQPPRSPEEAQQLAEYVYAADRLAAAGKGLLRGYTADHGPVGGYGHHRHVSRRISGIRQLVEILEANGYSDQLDEFLFFDGSKLGSVLDSKRKYVSLAEDLRPHVVEVGTTKFEWKAEAPETEDVEAPDSPTLSVMEGGQ